MYKRAENGMKGLGLFCRLPTFENLDGKSMRFGFTDGNILCKFYPSSSWSGTGKSLNTTGGGDVSSSSCGYHVGEDFYLTFVYVTYDKYKSAEYKTSCNEEYMDKTGNYDQIMDDKFNTVTSNGTDLTKTNYIDKVLYYVNGELVGYTYYGHDNYLNGCQTWNTEGTPFFVGVCPWWGEIFYLKGSIYTCRLYQTSMTPTQVSDNRDATMQYRASF